MSIPGLGSIPSVGDPTVVGSGGEGENGGATATTQTIELPNLGEYRFEVPQGATLTVRLLSGTAERDGTELAPQTSYGFTGPVKTKINTWQGCTLEVTPPSGENGPVEYTSSIATPSPDETPMVSYLNLHAKLESLRSVAAQNTSNMGPRVMVLGHRNSGKTTLARTLAAWATRMGRQPLVVNTDPSQGLLALPGTLSAAVYATVVNPTTDWGVAPSSGPSAVPVKLPIAHHYGLERPADNPDRYSRLSGVLADAVTARLAADPDVRTAGLIIDTPAWDDNEATDPETVELMAHLATEFSVNIVLVIGSERISSHMTARLGGQPTSLGEAVSVVKLDQSNGLAQRDLGFLQLVREAAIREYFFGDPVKGSALNPFTQQVDFSAVSVWKVIEAPNTNDGDDDAYDPESFSTSTPLPPASALPPSNSAYVEKIEPSLTMQNRILAVLYASTLPQQDGGPEAIRDATIMGFVYVAEADEKRRKLKVLAPVSARLGDRPLLWGSWPEPIISLLG